ncbi:nephronectin [Siphateles boraxobius]|uniref:nephronectin n=1 Tax=Siphateles boraxobius TaxID=180520 RepID=UPI00406439C6
MDVMLFFSLTCVCAAAGSVTLRSSRPLVLSDGLCQMRNSQGRCRHVCESGCKHGECVGPDQCHCHPGYTGKTCNQDVNECAFRPCKHRCMNTLGSFKCYCLNGFMLTADGSCRNARTCAMANCQYGCAVMKGEVTCQCPSPGLRLAPDGRTCVDVDECVTGQAKCARFRKCVNTFGSFVCRCHEGFELKHIDGKYHCTDKKSSSICYDKPGHKKCKCTPGVNGKGYDCKSVVKVTIEPARPVKVTGSPTTVYTATAPMTTSKEKTTTTAPMTTTKEKTTTTSPMTTTKKTTTTPMTTTKEKNTTTSPMTTTKTTTTTTTTTTPMTTTKEKTTTTAIAIPTTTFTTGTSVPTSNAFTKVTPTTVSMTTTESTTTTALATTESTTTTALATTESTTTTALATTESTTTTALATTESTTTTALATTESKTTTALATTESTTTTALATTESTTTTALATTESTTTTALETTTTSPTTTSTTTETLPTTGPVITTTALASVSNTTLETSSTTTLDNHVHRESTAKPRGDVHIPRYENNLFDWDFDVELGNTAEYVRDDPATGVVSCSFDEGLCFWMKDSEGDLKWEIRDDPAGGRYLSAPEATNRRSVKGARLTVPLATPTKAWKGGDLCLAFRHRLHGNHIGSLQVFVRKGRSHSPSVWTTTGGHGWRHTQITLGGRGLVDIVLKAQRRRGKHGEITVDDLSLRRGACSDRDNRTDQ